MPPSQTLDKEGRTFRQYTADQVMAAIIASGKSIRQVAEDTGIARATLQRRVRGELPFTVDEVGLIAAALEMHPADLINAAGFVVVHVQE